MSALINKFNIFRYFPPNLKQNIKSFYVSRYKYDDNWNEYDFGYCVLNDNTVYGLGEDIHVFLGYKRTEEKYVLINELYNIQEFYEGNNCMFAQNDVNEIFSWGKNSSGQLARGYQSNLGDPSLRPEKISFFDNKNIIEMSCGEDHCLALSSDGLIYGWGDNYSGQVGCGERETTYILTPIEIGKERIKYIHCLRCVSFAVSFDGNAYYWGRICGKSIFHPIMLNTSIKIKNILQDSVSEDYIYVLSFKGIIYEFSDERVDLKIVCDLNQIQQKDEIIDLFIESLIKNVIYETQECVNVFQKSKIDKILCKTLFEYLLHEFQKTFKTTHIIDNKVFVLKLEMNEENCEHLEKTFKQINTINCGLKQTQETNLSLNILRDSKDLPQILESKVKYYYQSGRDFETYFGFFVMNDNKVYCLGHNFCGRLGLGHNKRIFENTEIPELSFNNIQEFYQGWNFMLARNDQNEIFSWGDDFAGQLARGFQSKRIEYLKPEKISFFDNKNIIEINCGLEHCLALSSDGRVYGWGNNKEGQVGCGESEDWRISTPTEIELNDKIKYINCSGHRSFAVSFGGNAYYWGMTRSNKNVFIPKLIPMKNVSKGYYYYSSDVFIILDNNGKLILFNHLNEEFCEIKIDEIFRDIYYQDYCILQSEEYVYQLESNVSYEYGFEYKLIKTGFINFFDFYSQRLDYYKKTVEIALDGYLVEKQIQFNENKDELILINKYVFERKYENMFEEINVIEEGGFGIVYEVRNNNNNNLYAIKRMEINDELDFEEIRILSQLNNDYAVQYIDSWIEGQIIFGKIKRYLFIQMELFKLNLRDFIDLMKKSENKPFRTYYYFISCEILRELTECVNYLHSLNIIHRDLKPANILISENPINGRFLKLCDFGLAKLHDESFHSRMVGSISYMAPEILNSNNYNTKSDIYSVALIATEIFLFEDSVKRIRNHKNPNDFNNYLSKFLNTILEKHFSQLLVTLSKCLLQEDYHLRPDCNQLLETITMDENILSNIKNNSEFRLYLSENHDTIKLKKYFESKIRNLFKETNLSLNKLLNFKELPQIFESYVNYYYQSGSDSTDYFAFFVMNDNKVYCFGDNNNGKLGLGHNKEIYEYTEIPELRDNNIQEFYEGSEYMFARNQNNEIFSWGQNFYGQLARPYQSKRNEYLKPEKISFFEDKNIIEISCGFFHCLALSSDGRVYGWGYSDRSQFGCGEEKGKVISTPILIDFKVIIKFIHCAWNISFAVSSDGNAYYLEYLNENIFILIPKLIPIKNVSKVYYDDTNEVIIILDNNGKVFIFNLKFEEINEIKCQDIFTDLYYEYCDCILQSEECVYQLVKNESEYNLIKTGFINFFDFFLNKSTQYQKTIEITNGGYFMIKDIEFDVKQQKLIAINKYVFEMKYENMFEEIKVTEEGGFGTIYEVRTKSNNQLYTIRMIEINGELDLKEIEILHEITNDFSVKYIDAWVEVKVLFNMKIKKFLFIQLEQCKINLRNLAVLMKKSQNERLQTFNYMCLEYLRPEIIDYFGDKTIIKISCGDGHCLALSSDGFIYGWGDNRKGQVGCGKGKGHIISTPIEIELNEKIKFIHCSCYRSFAVSVGGKAYCWGGIGSQEEIIFTPKLIPKIMENVSKVYYFASRFNKSQEVLIILAQNGIVFLLNPLNNELFEIYLDQIFTDLYCDDYQDYCILQSKDCVYRLEINESEYKLIKTDFINFFDFYSHKSQEYQKTIEITKDGYLVEKQIKCNENEPNLIVIDNYVFERKYENMFDEIKELGTGNVYEVRKKSNRTHYAIKRMAINGELKLNEIRIQSLLNSDFAVQYIDSWIEPKVLFKKIQKFLLIQMELCKMNLRDIIDLMKKSNNKRFQTFNYFISCELWKELTECVNYLHSFNPPIIHRDLKPENILISDGINGRFLKLCDFGLSKIHEKSLHSRMVGTDNYMAPEVRYSKEYNTKADIYSLALIATEIFVFEENVKTIRNHKNSIDFDKYLSQYMNTILEKNFRQLLATFTKCLLQDDYHLRPDCTQLLETITMDENISSNIKNNSEFIFYLSENKDWIKLKEIFERKFRNL